MLTDEEVRDNLAGNLKRLMGEKNISQRQLAAAVGVAPMTINHYLAGTTTKASASAVSRIAAHLGVSIESLIGQALTPKTENSV